MSEVWLIIKEQVVNMRTIFRLSRYEEKATYQSHYLGLLWQVLNPVIQVGIYYLVFGLGVNGGRKIDGVPFIAWMLIGITAWFFINSSLLGASNSIYRQVNVVSKMKFPVSILPTTNMIISFWCVTFNLLATVSLLFLCDVYVSLGVWNLKLNDYRVDSRLSYYVAIYFAVAVLCIWTYLGY